MNQRRVAFQNYNNVTIERDDVQQYDTDGYQVRVTKTEWTPSTIDVPHYPNLHFVFNNKAHEDLYGNRYEEQVVPKKAAEKVHVTKHVHYEQINEGNGRMTKIEEDINYEADDFIKRKHRALELSKLMSMRAS
ncbi:hypothetical protein IFM89_033477 [Coptis chinensis]|uniref:Uncharacterized protein n=1 Tax=Coptis chinensis TaxID=261450 RepID=A0A835LTS0_9MAGN|nr:hypothetical protein IFM89_033477 [Coptis chinensis]